MLRVFLLLMVCSLISVQGIRHRPGEIFMVRRRGQLVNVTEPEFAKCMTTDQVVHFKNEGKYKNFEVRYFPHCTRVKKCSGCCLNPLHTCQPDETELRNFIIGVSKYDVKKSEWISGLQEIISMQEDKSCKCACPIKKECGKNQELDTMNCECVCTNFDEQRKCLRDKKKYWDAKKCSCKCKRLGRICDPVTEIRNPKTCRCERVDFELDQYEEDIDSWNF